MSGHSQEKGDAEGIAQLTHRSPEREAWHYQMMEALVPHFAKLGHNLPIDRIKIGVGYTSSGKRKNSASIGECLYLGVDTPQQRYEVTIRLDQEGDDNVSATLIHELCHASLPVGTGHKAPFRELMRRFGIEIEATGQHKNCHDGNATPAFIAWVRAFRQENGIGAYPHRGFKFAYEAEQQKKKQKPVPYVRLRCDECGAKASMSVQWFAKGAVLCGNDECECAATPMRVVEKKI